MCAELVEAPFDSSGRIAQDQGAQRTQAQGAEDDSSACTRGLSARLRNWKPKRMCHGRPR